MAVEIIEYFACTDKNNWIKQIERSDWEAAKYLGKLLAEDNLRELCGPSTKLFMFVENGRLCAFCTLAEQDEIKAPEMTPWLGFVFCFPEYRGLHYTTELVNYVCDVAKKQGCTEIFTSPSDDTAEFYEKLGFSLLDYPMASIYGYDTKVFRKDL